MSMAFLPVSVRFCKRVGQCLDRSTPRRVLHQFLRPQLQPATVGARLLLRADGAQNSIECLMTVVAGTDVVVSARNEALGFRPREQGDDLALQANPVCIFFARSAMKGNLRDPA